MFYRSTNPDGQYVHHLGAIVAGVNSSHGVEIDGGSTGGMVRAVGDDANISLSLLQKGAGLLILGTSTGPVSFGGIITGNSTEPVIGAASTRVTIGATNAQVNFGGSTAPFYGFVRYTDTGVATPNFNTTNIMVMETTHVLTGVNSSHFILAQGRNLSTDCALVGVYPSASTAGDVHCRFIKASTLTVAASTATIDFLVFRF
jgi:hypothetical protein